VVPDLTSAEPGSLPPYEFFAMSPPFSPFFPLEILSDTLTIFDQLSAQAYMNKSSLRLATLLPFALFFFCISDGEDRIIPLLISR